MIIDARRSSNPKTSREWQTRSLVCMCEMLQANYKGSSAEAWTPAGVTDSLSLAAAGWAKNSVMGQSTLFHKPDCTTSMCAKEQLASDCTWQNRPSMQYLKHNHLPAICGVF